MAECGSLHEMEANVDFWSKIEVASWNYVLKEFGNLGALYIRTHLELSPLGLEVGLNFSPTLQSGP